MHLRAGAQSAPLATVLVCRAGGKPSTWFPPGTRRADNLSATSCIKFPTWKLFELQVRNSRNLLGFSENFENSILWNIFIFEKMYIGSKLAETFKPMLCEGQCSIIFLLVELFKLKIPSSASFSDFFLKFRKIFFKYQLFNEHTRWFKTKVCSSTKADTQGK